MSPISKTSQFHSVDDLAFPTSLREFQNLFPDDASCAAYLERIRWERGFECPHCHQVREPYRFTKRPGVLRCRSCRRDIALTAGTLMERTHSPLSTWFWAAYLVSSMTPGLSAVQFQRQLGISRYETAFQILHKLRAGMHRGDSGRIGGGSFKDRVEVEEMRIGRTKHDEGRRIRNSTHVIAAVEVCRQKPKDSDAVPRRGCRYAGRVRLEVLPDRNADALCDFVAAAIEPGTIVATNNSLDYATLTHRGYQHLIISKRSKSDVAEDYLSMVRLVFLNLNSWLRGTHHGVSSQHLQAYLNEFAFRFNRRRSPFNAFRSLLGLAGGTKFPTYDALYSGDWRHATMTSGPTT